MCEFYLTAAKLNHVYLYSRCIYYLFYFSCLIHLFNFCFQKLDATIFDSRGLIAIAIGAGSLAAVIVLIFVTWRLRIRSKEIKKINLNRNQTRLKAWNQQYHRVHSPGDLDQQKSHSISYRVIITFDSLYPRAVCFIEHLVCNIFMLIW